MSASAKALISYRTGKRDSEKVTRLTRLGNRDRLP
jgi:hypothetical protein